MKRFAAYDPPEYVNWKPDPALVTDYKEIWRADAARRHVIESLTESQLLALYRGMLRTRLHDIMLKRWVRQGVISKAWLGTGEEATTIGPVHALDRAVDVVAPMIRNAGACCEMGMSVADMLRGYLGTHDSPSHGRDGHVGSFEHRVLQPISNIGNIPPVAAGIALSFRMRNIRGVVLTWIGDGAVKSGPTHEAMNFAAVQRLPVVFIIQNNQVALGTPVQFSHLPGDYDDLAQAYGVPGASCDGNNVLDAFAATRIAADRCRSGDGPFILTARTFRMGGHATHDEREARSVLQAPMFEWWGRRDPIGLYEEYLKAMGRDEAQLASIEADVAAEVDQEAAIALASRGEREAPPESAVDDVYAA